MRLLVLLTLFFGAAMIGIAAADEARIDYSALAGEIWIRSGMSWTPIEIVRAFDAPDADRVFQRVGARRVGDFPPYRGRKPLVGDFPNPLGDLPGL